MQFVSNGPDIPDRLLALHEEGNVVFFCGAGISYDAGLPGFSKLTQQLYEEVGEPAVGVEQTLIDQNQYDLAINLLEGRTTGGRPLIRKQLAKILTPKPDIFDNPEALSIHRALLILSKDRTARHKLITTNFDRIFEEIISRDALNILTEVAPHLPLPKKSRWDSIVYLHGLLPEELNDNALNRLVISSGDFGLAYLIERWASRFVTELFRNFTVCFVGYSINDPVMRYMMDALAADRLLGESSPEMFAFMSYDNELKKKDFEKEWQAKNITSLLYYVDPIKQDHDLLKETLKSWADTYRDGIFGKEQIVVRYAPTKPDKSTAEDNFIDRMLWALSDPSGLPAKRFAELNPSPSLDWLEPITQYILKDESRNNISLVSYRNDFVFPLNNSKKYILKWLLNYIDDPRLIVWIAKYGGRLHPAFVREIEHSLEEKQPSEPLLALWRIILTERLISGSANFDVYRWADLLKINGFTPALRMHLRNVLKPLVKINKSLDIYGEIYSEDNIKKYIDWEIELGANHARSSIELLEKKPEWIDALPALLSDFTTLLQDTVELMFELGEAEEKHDTTSWHMPSIEEHPQNKGFRDWTLLIELVRDAWLETAKGNPEVARVEVMRWQSIRYPVFRRLTFYAGTRTNLFSNDELIMWLLDDEHYWLWSGDTKREVIRLLVSLATKVDPSECEQIENAILLGVPRNMYREDIELEEFKLIQDRSIWLRLIKLQEAGVVFSKKAATKLNILSEKYTGWKLAEDERDEFTTWMSSGFDGEKFSYAPKDFDALKEWLDKEKKDSAFERDNWEEFTSKYVLYSSKALMELAKEGKWNIPRWSTALYAWSRALDNKKSIYTYWSSVGEQLLNAPDKVFKELAHSFSYWLQAVAKQTNGSNEDIFFELVTKVLNIYEIETIDAEEIRNGDQVSKAINHPIGHMMKAVLDWWKHKELLDGMGLDISVEAIFSQVCNSDKPIFYHGQLIIATDTIALYRVDQKWTQEYLLPLFDWIEKGETAPGVWKGLLWSPRLYKPLFKEIKSSFLQTSEHCEEMESFGKQYANLLTFVALDSGDIFNQEELRDATRSLTPECLENSASTLRDLLSSSSQKQEYWTNQIKLYLHHIWPKGSSYLTDEIVDKFALLCVDSDEIFPEVFESVNIWLRPLDEDPHYILGKMKDKKLCKEFPDISLEFLCKLIEGNIAWSHKDLRECLDIIGDEQEDLKNSVCYQKLLREAVS